MTTFIIDLSINTNEYSDTSFLMRTNASVYIETIRNTLGLVLAFQAFSFTVKLSERHEQKQLTSCVVPIANVLGIPV